MKTQRETPKWLANKMATDILSEYHVNLDEIKVLEPSAGTGAIADAITEFIGCMRMKLTCVELNADKCDVLREKGYDAIHGDFLAFAKTCPDRYDMIVACPPFKNNIDLEHIMAMYGLLAEHGTLMTLTSPYWLVNNEPHHVMFREFLRDKGHSLEMLPDNTFVEKGRTVHTAILTMHKQTKNDNEAILEN